MSFSARCWYTALVGGLLPILLLGFVSSALANRLVFLFWALAVGAGYLLLLRHGWRAGWSGNARAAAQLALVALGLMLYGLLVARHQEILDLGWRAMLPELYRPWMTRPASAFACAGGLAGLGAVLLLARRWAGSRPALRSQPLAGDTP